MRCVMVLVDSGGSKHQPSKQFHNEDSTTTLELS